MSTTWSQDVARGLDHPYSMAARAERRQIRSDSEAGRRAALQHGLYLLGRSVRTNTEAVQVLHCIASSMAAANPLFSSDEAETIESLDMLADEIEYKKESA